MASPTMPLSKAVYIIADIHTMSDDMTGFVIMHGACPQASGYKWSQEDYWRAWESLRAHSHMPYEPKIADKL